MKKFFFCMTLTAGLLSCSKEPEDTNKGTDPVDPTVILQDVTPKETPSTIAVLVTPHNAVSCAWICAPETGAHYEADNIFALGSKISAAEPTTVTVENLKPETAYVFSAAVKDASGKIAVETLLLTTGQQNEIHFSGFANTHIVSSAGKFSFETRKVSGAPIDNIVSADWIWATKESETDTEQNLISEVSYADGKIQFNATGKHGSAVIAAFDASDNVVWEWLVWCTPKPDEMKFASGSIFLDRAIGATSADPADGIATWGSILYQWGRPTPIFSGYIDEWGAKEAFNEAIKWTVTNPEYGFGWKTDPSAVSISEAIAKPTTFFIGTKGSWMIQEDRTLWGKEKTDYDPCPAGYRITVPEDWGECINELDIAADQSGATYSYDGKSSYFPQQNQGRAYDTGENIIGSAGFTYWNAPFHLFDPYGFIENGTMTEEDAIAAGLAYWSASRVYKTFVPQTTGSGTRNPANPSFAFSVRCVRQ